MPRLLAGWLAWARRFRLPGVVKLAKSIRRHRQLIWHTLEHEPSNARVEATHSHLRALTRRAHGFHRPQALIAVAQFAGGGLGPPLPHHTAT